MFEMKPYEVYIKTNENNFIIAVNSSEFLTDTSEWLKIDEGYGDKYHHAQGNYFSNPIMTDSGVYRYKYDGAVRECTAEEIAEQEANIPVPAPSDKERIAELESLLDLLLGVNDDE